jgi:hypothetical protein
LDNIHGPYFIKSHGSKIWNNHVKCSMAYKYPEIYLLHQESP